MSVSESELFRVLSRGNGTVDGYPPEVKRLADAFAFLHGDVEIATESGGIHLYFADPGLLQVDGAKELRSKHCSVNASKYFGLGTYLKAAPSTRRKCASCMKNGMTYTVDQLLNYFPLAKRGIPDVGPGSVISKAREAVLIEDANGNMIPDYAGKMTPVNELPPEHPAAWYLLQRGFNLQVLYDLFRASYCSEEAPPVKDKRGYRRLVDGWNNTPQGRIIFHGDVRGVQRIWQGRIIDHSEETRHFVWHPYRAQWCVDAIRDNSDSPWQYVHPYDRTDDNGAFIWKDLAKYYNVAGGQRNMAALGFDPAIRWNLSRDPAKRFCVLVEGPLDAGKIGSPAIAVIGKFLSPGQAELLASEFPTVLIGYDNDTPGRDQREKAAKVLNSAGARIRHVFAPEQFKDWGEMTKAECWRAVMPVACLL